MKNTVTGEPYNFPIQFKELNHSDFENYTFESEEKTIITPDKNGYISDELYQLIDLKKTDTTVINAGVGQGKTKAIIDFINWYLSEILNNSGKYKIVIVTPFKSLNKEYVKKIEKVADREDIFFEYQELDNAKRLEFDEKCLKPIQLISIKSLLGDPGQKGFKQSEVKRAYYEYLIDYCKTKDLKVIMFFDELHESLSSFTPELIPNLFKWKEVIYKIFVASATLSESSKVPIKFFAELTQRKIRIIESKRIQNKDNLSSLHLCLYNRPTLDIDDLYLQELFKEIINSSNFSTVNILTFKPSLAEQLYESPIGLLIKEKFGSLNLCIGDDKENKFDHDLCNIGTTFKTGISIEKENSAFVVILPDAFSNVNNKLGIFTDRANSLIQALARPRNKSNIFVIAPSPRKLILKEDDEQKYIEKLSLGYLEFNDRSNQTSYIDLKQQDELLQTHYQSIRDKIGKEIEVVSNLDQEIRTFYHSYDWFKLKEGDKILSTTYYPFGKDLASYLYWAVWNNQFVNCRLSKIIKKQAMSFTEGNIQKELDKYIPESILNERSFIDYSDKNLFEKIRNILYSNNIYFKKKGSDKKDKLTPFTSSSFEQQIIHFIQRRKTPYLFEPEYGNKYSSKEGDKPIDIQIKKEKYIRTCISQCLYVIEASKEMPEHEFKIISAYNDLYMFKDILLKEYTTKNSEGKLILPTDSNFAFKNLHSIKLKSIFQTLKKDDIGFKIFNAKSILDEKSMYSLLRKIFFKATPTKSSNGSVLRIDREYSLEYSEYKLNLVYDVNDPFLYFPIPPDKLQEARSNVEEDWQPNIIDWQSNTDS